MAKHLYRLGLWTTKHAKGVLFSAIGLLIALGAAVLMLWFNFDDNMSIPGTPAQNTIEMLEQEFPEVGKAGAQIQIVFKSPEGKVLLDTDVQESINELLEEVNTLQGVAAVYPPSMLNNYNEDQTIAYAMAIYDKPSKEITYEQVDELRNVLYITEDDGIQTELSSSDTELYPIEIHVKTEIIGIGVAFIILFFTFGSLILAGMPIITAGIGLLVGLAGIVIASHAANISFVCISLAAMLGLAVGIDYGLFIISRFRQEYIKGYSVKQAIAIANGTAGTAVVFAGLTVIIALIGLAIPQIPFLSMMGFTAALTVLLAVIVAVLVVPAIIYLLGDKALPSVKRNRTLSEKLVDSVKFSGKIMSGWAKTLDKMPILFVLVGTILLGAVTIPFFHMELGLPDDSFYEKGTDQREAYDLLKDAYGEGYHASLVIVAKASEENSEILSKLEALQADIMSMDNVDNITNVIPKETGDMAVITLNPTTGPNDPETKELVNTLRNSSYEGMTLHVTGTTAMNIDISVKLGEALPVFAALIIGLAFVIFVIIFRSLLVPLKAVLGFVLSLGATLGFVTWVIQDGNLYEAFGFATSGPVLNFLPILTIGILFGLAMDYEVFLVSRMREEFTHSGDARKAVLSGIRDSGGVVTAAGLIMIAVFTGFMMAPDPMTKVIGLALAFGVLFDAFVVRMMIVPGVMLLMGKAAWYMPKWLDKILPNIDIEGESVIKELEASKQESINETKHVMSDAVSH
ncbi:MMPL family transporter [Paenibacillus antibioticophila]|uniref:MMPL family transporter n=1 Tax=Paenibacillus antibioticophila TaxID=1274374 RepID=UPI0005C9975D|nr:MMPL family transporter [Paenibacillus antibioticophila]